MNNRQTAKALLRSIKPQIEGYALMKLRLLGQKPTVDLAKEIAKEAAPRFVDLILDEDERNLREPVREEVEILIVSSLVKMEGRQMVSERQHRANCENAKLGGVKTIEGKSKSKKNSLKHGILAQGSISSDSVSLEDVYNQLHQEFKPETPSSEFLIQQLALTIVRLARCSRLEVEIYKDKETWDTSTELVIERLATLGERYESRLVGRMLLLLDTLKVK